MPWAILDISHYLTVLNYQTTASVEATEGSKPVFILCIVLSALSKIQIWGFTNSDSLASPGISGLSLLSVFGFPSLVIINIYLEYTHKIHISFPAFEGKFFCFISLFLPNRTTLLFSKFFLSKLNPANLFADFHDSRIFVAFACPSLMPGAAKKREIHGALRGY